MRFRLASLVGVALAAGLSTGAAHAAGDWSTATNCSISSHALPDQPRLNVFASKVAAEDGKTAESARLGFTKVEPLSTAPTATFSGVKLSTSSGNPILENVDATGKTEKTGYTLTVPIVDSLPQILTALAKGSELQVIVPTDSGEKTFTIDLTGSGKAVSSLRTCLG